MTDRIESTSPVAHVSDTARWVAAHRALESERSDALFRDPLADLLAGPHGRAIASAADNAAADHAFLVTRTVLIDEHIAAAVAEGCDTVVNLGAGLDTRPYRMDLPSGVRWLEVDLDPLLAEKTRALAAQTPRCAVRRVAIDVTDVAALRDLVEVGLADAVDPLFLSEGLVMYLAEREVVGLSEVLRRPGARWCLDFSAAGVASMVAERNEGLLRRAPWTFLPHDGVGFFEDLGWEVRGLESILAGGVRCGRSLLPEGVALPPEPDPRAPGDFPYSAVTMLAAT